MILSAQTIRRLCLPLATGLVHPFHERTVRDGMSFGLSSCGYDARIDQDVVLAPGDFSLASTMERFDLPASLCMLVKDKSTWARRGLAVQNTIAEPGWRGFLTLELTNHGRETLVISRGMPIAQMVFHMLDAETCQPYRGKYQDQRSGAVPAMREGDE